MDKDQDGARAEQVKDSLQEAIGKITGNVAAQDGGARNRGSRLGHSSRDGVEAEELADQATDLMGKQRRD